MKMRFLFSFCASVALASSANAGLIITGVYDGPLPGGDPKGVELYATADIADLSTYGIGTANNGGGSDGVEATLPAVSLTAGDFYYLTNGDGADFATWFGFASDFQAPGGAVGHNGDDGIELFFDASGDFTGAEVVVDVFGDIDTDGSGEVWDNVDGWAYRVAGVPANGGVFDPADWTFSGINVWDGEAGLTNATSSSPMPIGTYVAIPEPGSAVLALLSLAAVGAVSMRSRLG